MSSIAVLRKTFINEYYRLNAGFFFVILMFGGGFLRGEDHIVLATYIVQSPFLLAITFGLWVLYHLKTIWFVRQRLGWDSHIFLYNLILLPRWQRWLLLLFVQYGLWLPVWFYALFMAYCGQQIEQQTGVWVTLAFVTFLPLTGVWAYNYRLFRPSPDHRISVFSTYFNRRFNKPFWSYFLWYLTQREPVLLLLTKFFTGGVVVGACLLYTTDSYDERLLSLAGILAGIGQVIVLFHLYEFEHLQLPLLRNLPMHLGKRFAGYTLLFFLLILPEIMLFLRYLPLTVGLWYAVQWVGWLLSLVWLIFGRFLCKHYIMDYILRQSFYVFIGYFFLIMFGVPLFVLVLTNLALGIWWFKAGYYSSEYIMPQVFFGKSEQKP
jgi:hypothetical protein